MWERGLLGASTISGRQRDKRETHALTLDQLREREGQNHLPGSDLCARLQRSILFPQLKLSLIVGMSAPAPA